jgi:hypothetical protein
LPAGCKAGNFQRSIMPLITKSRVRYFLRACGWILLLLAGTDLFLHVFVVTSFPFTVLKNGHIFEISGYEGYGFTRYLPYAEIKTPYDSGEYSVVVLGNSFTMSKQVMDWQSYCSHTSPRLFISSSNSFRGFVDWIYNTHGHKLRFPPSEKSAICDRVRYSSKIGLWFSASKIRWVDRKTLVHLSKDISCL